MAVSTATAKTVRDREHDRCQLCMLGEYEVGSGPEWRLVLHHVKLKGIGGTSDPDRDAPCNLALLHAGCHDFCHANPRQARALGLIESRLGKVSPSGLIARRPA